MNKVYFSALGALFLVLVFFSGLSAQTFTTDWQRALVSSDLPSWFGADTERGMGYGTVGDNKRMFVASRSGGVFVRIIDATNGNDVGTLNTTGVTGGTFAINDVEVSADGVIFASNMTLNASTSAFKVYSWSSESAVPTVVLDGLLADAVRLGDKFTVTGSVAEGTAKIWAASATPGQGKVYVWSMTEGSFSATPSVISLSDNLTSGAATVGPLPNGSFWFNYNGIAPKKYSATGELLGTVLTSVIPSGSNAIRHIGFVDDDEYVAVFSYGVGNERATIFRVPNGNIAATSVFAQTPSLRSVDNFNGAGDVEIKLTDDGKIQVFVLSANHGIGAYTTTASPFAEPEDPGAPLAGEYYIPQGTNDRGFATLNAAFSALSANGISGAVTFLIDDNLDEKASIIQLSNVALTAVNNLTIRPAPGKTPKITVAGTNTADTESNGAGIVFFNTPWVTIDGSATPGSNSRDMTIEFDHFAGANGIISIIGSSSNITVSNTNLVYLNASGSITGIRVRRNNADTVVPKNLVFSNNLIGTSDKPVKDGIALFGNGARTVQGEVTGSDIFATHRGITTFVNEDVTFDNNRITITNPLLNQGFYAGIYLAGVIGDSKVTNNEIIVNSVNRSASAAYASGINTNANAGTLSIFNNMISIPNLTNTGAVTDNRIYAIGLSNAGGSAVHNIYHNTIYIGESSQTGIAAAFGSDFTTSSQAYHFRNNNFVVSKNASNAYVIHWPFTNTVTVSSDNNNFNAAGENTQVARLGAQDFATLSGWQNATGLDANSVNFPVTFVSNTDLRLAGSSLGDMNLAASPLASVTKDIDGNDRDAVFPYAGAFEGAELGQTITGSAGWRLLSLPKSGVAISSLASQNLIQGIAGGDYTSASSNFISGFNGTSWVSPSNVSDQLQSGYGFGWFMYNNTTVPESKELPVRLLVKGTEPASDVTVDVNSGEAWSLLGNPFSQPIEVSALTGNEGNSFYSTVQIWQPSGTAGTADGWILSSDPQVDGKIQPWQGFILASINSTEITIPTSAKVNGGGMSRIVNPIAQVGFRLLTTIEGQETVMDRAAILQLRDDASHDMDRHDLIKMSSLNAQSAMLYFLGDNFQGEPSAKAQESRPVDFTSSFEIPMDVVSYGITGDFTIDWPSMTNMPDDVTIRLLDTVTGETTVLEEGGSYTFSLNAMPKRSADAIKAGSELDIVSADARFKLLVDRGTTTDLPVEETTPQQFALDQNFPNPFNPTTTIRFTLPESSNVRLVIYDLTGRQVSVLVNESMSAGQHMVNFNASTLASGVYIYRLDTPAGSLTRKMTLVK